jgi:Acetoacetate decarboxylase (ADC)
MNSSKPNYVDMGGDIVFSQPFEAIGVNFYGFFLEADEAKLTEYCDRMFNIPSGGQVSIKPAGPFVMLVFCDLPELTAMNPPYSNYGKFSESECAIWLQVVDEKRERLFFAFPYIWVDNEYAMAMGRELYGFPKGIANFQIPDSPEQAESFSLSTLVVDKFGPTAQGRTADLIKVRRTSEKGGVSVWGSIKDGLSALVGLLKSQHGITKDFHLMFNELKDAINLKIPFVFLKQFRDVEDGSKACYQSIVEVPCGLTHFESGGLLAGEYEVDILDCDSAPLRSTLGLASGPIKPSVSFWCRFNFEIGDGTEVWNSNMTVQPAKSGADLI